MNATLRVLFDLLLSLLAAGRFDMAALLGEHLAPLLDGDAVEEEDEDAPAPKAPRKGKGKGKGKRKASKAPTAEPAPAGKFPHGSKRCGSSKRERLTGCGLLLSDEYIREEGLRCPACKVASKAKAPKAKAKPAAEAEPAPKAKRKGKKAKRTKEEKRAHKLALLLAEATGTAGAASAAPRILSQGAKPCRICGKALPREGEAGYHFRRKQHDGACAKEWNRRRTAASRGRAIALALVAALPAMAMGV